MGNDALKLGEPWLATYESRADEATGLEVPILTTHLRLLLAEIRERRTAQRLTTDERKALQTLREDVEEFGTPTLSKRHCTPLLDVINRLLAPATKEPPK